MRRILFAVLIGSLLTLSACTTQSPGIQSPQSAKPPAQNSPPPGQAQPPINQTNQTVPKTVEFSIIADDFAFMPDTLTVDKGDTIVLKLKSIDVAHGLAIPQFGVNQYMPVGQEVTVTFVADKAGEYPFRCSVYCGEGHGRMRGTLIVQ